MYVQRGCGVCGVCACVYVCACVHACVCVCVRARARGACNGRRGAFTFPDGHCSTVQGLLDWFEVDLGFTELSFIQIGLCVMCVFVLYSPLCMRVKALRRPLHMHTCCTSFFRCHDCFVGFRV